MKIKNYSIIICLLIISLLVLTGCNSTDTNKTYSDDISDVPGISDELEVKSSIDDKTVKNIVLTAENYEKVLEDAGTQLSEDDVLYLMYAIMANGLNAMQEIGLFNLPEDYDSNSANYGKTVNELIEEGKQYMKENNITPQEWKKQLEQSEN